MLPGEERLIGVIAFDSDTELETASFVDDLRVVVDVVVTPGFEGGVDDQSFLADSDPFDDLLLHVQ